MNLTTSFLFSLTLQRNIYFKSEHYYIINAKWLKNNIFILYSGELNISAWLNFQDKYTNMYDYG